MPLHGRRRTSPPATAATVDVPCWWDAMPAAAVGRQDVLVLGGGPCTGYLLYIGRCLRGCVCNRIVPVLQRPAKPAGEGGERWKRHQTDVPPQAGYAEGR